MTQAVSKVEGYKTLTLVQSAGATGMVVIECPDGDTFDRGNVAGTLRAVARLYRGASVDVTVKNPVWEVLDSANGGWRALAAAHHTGPDASGRCTLTVKPSEVLNFQTFRCTLTDSESGEKFSNIITFYDATDRSTVEVYTLTGNVIKNGQGDTDIYARLWRDGVKVEDIDTPDADRKYTYRWTKYNANGLPENWAGTTSNVKDTAKVPKVTLTAAEVSGKATVHCHVVYTVDFTAALDNIYTRHCNDDNNLTIMATIEIAHGHITVADLNDGHTPSIDVGADGRLVIDGVPKGPSLKGEDAEPVARYEIVPSDNSIMRDFKGVLTPARLTARVFRDTGIAMQEVTLGGSNSLRYSIDGGTEQTYSPASGIATGGAKQKITLTFYVGVIRWASLDVPVHGIRAQP